jgi:riboflavin synthase
VFTGIINAIGQIASIEMQEGQGTYRIATGELAMESARPGDSIAVNGTCLTVTELYPDGFSADLSRETLDCTTLGEKKTGASVNLERALCLGESLGGHLVTGHVDGIGVIRKIEPDVDSLRLAIEVPEELARYIAQKGSVCVDGTSLTVNAVDGAVFELMIVPHTQAETTISAYGEGTRVNIEVDMIARYLERIVQYTGSQAGS